MCSKNQITGGARGRFDGVMWMDNTLWGKQ